MKTDWNDNQLREWQRGNTAASTQCPSARSLARLASGRWVWRRQALVSHLAECSHCAQEYQVLQRVQPGLEGALAGSELVAAKRPAWGMALASVVAVAALSVAVLTQVGHTPGSVDQPIAESSIPALDQSGDIFGGEFEARQLVARHRTDNLFNGDFDTGPQTDSAVFTDEFDG